MQIYWFMPLSVDIRHIGMWPEEGADPTLEHVAAIVAGSEAAGFDGLLVPSAYGNHHDAWTASMAVLAVTRRVRLLIAVRPFQYHPAQFAKMVITAADWFPGRLELNVVSGGRGDPPMLGIHDDSMARHARLTEWLEVLRGMLTEGRAYSFEGRFYTAERVMVVNPPTERVPIYLSGSSPNTMDLLNRFGDALLVYGAPVDAITAELAALRAATPERKDLTTCMRIHTIVRDTSEEAWRAADDLISRVDPRVRAMMEAEVHAAGSRLQGQQALATRDDLVVGPNLWAGVGTARYGAALALVGTPREVAERIREYAAAGADSIIVSGYPKLETVHRFGAQVMPLLADMGLR